MVSGKIDRFSTPVTHMPRALRSRSDGSTEGRTTAEGTTPPSHGKRATARQAASGVQRAVGRWRQGRCARGAVGSWRARNVPARRRRLGESPPIPRRSDAGLRIPASNGCSQARPWVLIALARSDWAMPRVRILDRQLRRRAAGDRPRPRRSRRRCRDRQILHARRRSALCRPPISTPMRTRGEQPHRRVARLPRRRAVDPPP